jgi:preprotein translocase subunit SecF
MEQVPQTHAKNWYDKSYKWLLLIPVVFLIVCIVYLSVFYVRTGDIIYKDVSLTGGTTITVFSQTDVQSVEQTLKAQFPDIVTRSITDIRSGQQRGFFIETAAPVDQVKPALEKLLGYELTKDNSSIEFTGSALSSSFYKQLRLAILMSFFLMAVVVFLIFRTPIRSLSVVIAGLADIVMTIAVIDFFGIRLSTAGIVALLMLIGYSVDVDILLTTRVVKHKEGTLNHRIYGAFKTGITMTLTAIVAIAVALIFTHNLSSTLSQMFTIILIGLGFDIINCWITNASILKWYAEVSHKI